MNSHPSPRSLAQYANAHRIDHLHEKADAADLARMDQTISRDRFALFLVACFCVGLAVTFWLLDRYPGTPKPAEAPPAPVLRVGEVREDGNSIRFSW